MTSFHLSTPDAALISLRNWAGFLHQPVTPENRKKLKDKAVALGKQMVIKSTTKKDNKPVVILALCELGYGIG